MSRAASEVRHGKRLTEGDPETTWGWTTPAGRLRAMRRAELISQGAGLAPGMRVLEIGCGTGGFTERFAESGASILAVDISPDLLERARARGLSSERVRFECRRFEDCDIDGPFDAVIGSSVLHHLDLDPAMRKICGLLKPGGALSFAEPNMLNPQVFAERKFRFLRRVFWYVSPDETAFVRTRFRTQLQACGFERVEITPFDWLHPATPKPMVSVLDRFGRGLEKLPLVREFAGSLHIRAYRPNAGAL